MNEKKFLIQKEEAEVEPIPEDVVKTDLQPDDWLCVVCNKRITSDKERFEYNNQSEFQFINPAGYYFNIITFFTAEGCHNLGDSTLDHTWFDGHAWSFAVCNRCRQHLGWHYSGKHSFYGLIRNRIVKGATLFN